MEVAGFTRATPESLRAEYADMRACIRCYAAYSEQRMNTTYRKTAECWLGLSSAGWET